MRRIKCTTAAFLMSRAHPLIIGVLVAWLFAPALASAQTGLIGTYKEWSAYAVGNGAQKVCYVGSAPTKEEGKYTRRGDTYVLVTHRPTDKVFGEVSVEAGYSYKAESEVDVRIDNKRFKLFTHNRKDGEGNAWTYDADADKSLVQAMKAGNRMVVKGTSARGTLTTDTYSLAGFTAAMNAINKACGAPAKKR